MELRIPLPKGEYIVFRVERRAKETQRVPEGMYEYPISPGRGINRELIRQTLHSEHSDVYLLAFENATGIRLQDRKYFK